MICDEKIRAVTALYFFHFLGKSELVYVVTPACLACKWSKPYLTGFSYKLVYKLSHFHAIFT